MLSALRHDWHQDIMVMVRDRLPKVVVVLLILLALQQILKFLVRRMERLATRQNVHLRTTQLRTMATIIRATGYSVLGLLAFLQILDLINIHYGPLLASAGILGVGIGLAAQSLFKDVINSIFILIEDQYNVGEVVKIAGLTGTVEDLTLRLTRLRDGDGTLYVIPNSQVATVSNLSRDYSLATLPVSVDAQANPDKVIATLKEMTAEIFADPAFKDVMLEAPNVLGVDKIDGRTVIYPVVFRVRPNQKFALLREFQRRIVLTFEARGLPLGSDSSLLIMQQAKSSAAAPDPTAPPASQTVIGG